MAKEILSAQHARDEKEKLEKLILKLKRPLLISAICSVIYYITSALIFTVDADSFLGLLVGIVSFVGIIGMLISDVIAIKYGGKTLLKLIGSILFFGFIFIPIPIVNLFIGCLVLVYALMACVTAPWLIFILAIIKMKRDIKKYNEYLQYNPVDTVSVSETNE